MTGSAAKSLGKALDILTTLGQVPDGMNLGDITLLVGQPKSTVHRLLTALEGRKFVRYEADSRFWKIGIEAFVVGNAFLRNRDLAQLARPIMQGLVNDTGETSSLYLEDDGEIVCIAQLECRQTMRVIARPGGRAPMHASGSGKAILAFREPDQIDRIIEHHGLPAATEKTIRTPLALKSELQEVRKNGFAVDDEENALGVRCVAAPIFDHKAEAVAAISISGPSTRLARQRLEELGVRVLDAAKAMSEAIGGERPA